MKKVIIGCLLGMGITSFLAFKMNSYQPSTSSAEANKHKDLFVFTDCKPVMPCDTLGRVQVFLLTDTQYESVRNALLSKTKRVHPEADGIILNFNKRGIDHGLAIKFK